MGGIWRGEGWAKMKQVQTTLLFLSTTEIFTGFQKPGTRLNPRLVSEISASDHAR